LVFYFSDGLYENYYEMGYPDNEDDAADDDDDGNELRKTNLYC